MPTKLANNWIGKSQIDLSDIINCNYLPSVNDSIPCLYKAVICGSPPNITNARFVKGDKANDETYRSKSQLQYECLDETFWMEGNDTVICRASGEWYKIPKCLKRKDRSMNPLHVVLPVLIIPLLVFMMSHIIRRNVCGRNKNQDSLIRSREYDAFVCYDYDEEDQDFAENEIRKEFEEKYDPPFKLCLHRRDFKAAWDIMWNIRNAIQNSNSAIIVMSQNNVDSLWCKEEFEQCYVEHMKDPAFKLFVIMMEPVEELKGTSQYMKSFFESKTFLERNDPKLFNKIGNYLSWVKKPKKLQKKSPDNHHEMKVLL